MRVNARELALVAGTAVLMAVLMDGVGLLSTGDAVIMAIVVTLVTLAVRSRGHGRGRE